jgi:hypothetical protein
MKAMGGQAAVFYKNKLVVFGGHDGERNFSNDL